jgi:hypothetical protein
MSQPPQENALAGRTGGKAMPLHEALILAGALSRIGQDQGAACDMANRLWPEHRWTYDSASRSVIVLMPVMPPPPTAILEREPI